MRVENPPGVTGSSFIPAKPRRRLIWPMEWLNRLVALPWLKIVVEISPEDLARLRALPRDAGTLVACNHPSWTDPFVMFEISRRWGRCCIWMAARELFSRLGGYMGKFIRRTGAFSVWRGGPNQDAAAFVRRTLSARDFPVVVFPEGHTFYLNDVLLPLKPGVAAWAVDTVTEHPDLPVRIVPLVIKYRYIEDIRDRLDAAVAQMERLVFRHPHAVLPTTQDDFWHRLYVRLYRVADLILARQQRLHRFHPPRSATIDERVHGLCAHIIRGLELRYTGKEGQGGFFDRARHLMTLLADDDDVQHQKDALDARFAWALSTFYAGYLQPDSSPERFAETVMKLLRELTDHVPLSFRVWRTATVRCGDPIDVNELVAGTDLTSSAGRRACADRALEMLSDSMHRMLEPMVVASGESFASAG